MKYNLRAIMLRAWKNYRKMQLSFAECLHRAWLSAKAEEVNTKRIEKAKAAETQIISCMGTGNKLDPSRFEIADISRTSVCPLAKVMRQELKRRRIHKVKVLYSREVPVKPRPEGGETRGTAGRPAPGSIAFVPSVAGLMIAGEVVRDLIRKNGKR